MKKNILTSIFALCNILLVQAQTYIQDYQHFFKGLKLQNSPHPDVIDLMGPRINPAEFNGSNQTDTSNIEYAEELARIVRSATWTKKNPIVAWDSLNVWANQYIAKGILPLLLIDYRTYKLSDSFWLREQYQYDSDSGYLSKMGPWMSDDFSQIDAFNFLPFYRKINQSIHSIILDSRFIIGHRAIHQNAILGIDINGTSHLISPNQPTPLQGVLPGINNCHLFLEADSMNERFNNNNGMFFSVSGTAQKRLLTLFRLHANPKKPEWETITNGLPIDYFDVKSWVSNEQNILIETGARVSIHYGNNKNGVNNCLKKPIVFVEGIDFGYRSKPIGCRDGKCGNTGYIDLLKGKQWNVESQSWSDWTSIENSPPLLKQYRDSGYDIVYIDFWDGADFIENNAAVTCKAIKEISQRLCGENIHVVGASMGSLVARRALTMLENDTISHCVRSYTSFDGPLLGANIPIGLQATLDYYSSASGKVEDMKTRMLNRPAAKQMLLHHYSQGDKPHPLFNKLLNDSTMQAYPKQPWLFAITNGSNRMEFQKADNFQDLIPGDSIIHFNLAEPLFKHVKTLIREFGGKRLALLTKVLPTSEAKIFTHSRKQTLNKQTEGTVAIFKTSAFKETSHLVDATFDGHDHISGGFSTFSKSLHESLSNYPLLVFTSLYASNTCFIPTWSALGSDSVRKNSKKPLSITIGTTPMALKNTPFHDYYSQSTNQDHVFFENGQSGNAVWLLKKLIFVEKQSYSAINETIFIGKSPDRFIGNLIVESQQILNVNREYTNSNIKPIDKSTAIAFKERKFFLGNCQSAELNILGTMNLGSGEFNHQATTMICQEKSSISVGQGGILILSGGRSTLKILRNSSISLNDNSTLIIGDGSQLIIEEGAKFNIGKNVKLRFNGTGAMIHVKGEMSLSPYSDLTIRSDSGFSTGLLKLSNMGGGFGKCSLKGENNNRLFIIGNDAKSSTVLQIEGEINTLNLFDSIEIFRANIKFGNHSRWVASGHVSIKNSGFFPTEWATKAQNGLVLTNGTFIIESCEFNKLNTGLCLQKDGVASISNTTFNQCSTGLLMASNGSKIKKSEFRSNLVGLEIHENLAHDSLLGCNFRLNATGISANGDKQKFPLHLIETGFYNNGVGIETVKRSIAVKCSIFGYNETGIKATETNLILGSNSKVMGEKDSLNCGDNTFAYSQKKSIYLNHSNLYLNGNNNFLCSNSASQENKIQIAGTIPNNEISPWNTKNSVIALGKNHWFPTDANDNIDSIQEKYLAIGAIDIGGRWYEIETSGTMLKKVNTLCFDPQNSLENSRRAAKNNNDNSWTNNEISLQTRSSLELSIPRSAAVYSLDGRKIKDSSNQQTWYEGLSPGFYLICYTNDNLEPIARRIFIGNSNN